MPDVADMAASVNEFSLWLGVWVGVVGVLGWAASRDDELDAPRFVAAFVGIIVIVTTRDLLWGFIGFEALSLSTLRLGARTMAGSLASLAGLGIVIAASGTTDLAAVDPSTSIAIGTVLFLAGVLSRWLQTSAVNAFVFLGAGIAIVSVFVRLAGWSPGLDAALAPLTWLVMMTGIVVGSIGAALSGTTRSLARWLTIAMVSLAVLAAGGGSPVLTHVLMHVGASTVALALLMSRGSRVVMWLTLLSLASFPPFPGFVTKLGLLGLLSMLGPLGGFSTWSLTLVLVALFFIGVGCARALSRNETAAPTQWWLLGVSLAATVAFGWFPEPLYGIAARAAAALF